MHRLLELSKYLEIHEILLYSIKELDKNFWFQQDEEVPTYRAVVDHARLSKETDLWHPIILSSNERWLDELLH